MKKLLLLSAAALLLPTLAFADSWQVPGIFTPVSGTLQINGILALKSGANQRAGTFVCTSGGTITIANTSFALTDTVAVSLKVVGGTVSTAPAVSTVTAGTGFTELCATSDTSTYNYSLIGATP